MVYCLELESEVGNDIFNGLNLPVIRRVTMEVVVIAWVVYSFAWDVILQSFSLTMSIWYYCV